MDSLAPDVPIDLLPSDTSEFDPTTLDECAANLPSRCGIDPIHDSAPEIPVQCTIPTH